jgi:hypothetical protein
MAVAAFGGEDYSFEELVAELISTYLCARNGIDNILENSSAYIQLWLKALRDDKTMLSVAEGRWKRLSTSSPGMREMAKLKKIETNDESALIQLSLGLIISQQVEVDPGRGLQDLLPHMLRMTRSAMGGCEEDTDYFIVIAV